MLSNRSDIVQFILKLEKDFQVNTWKVNQVHLWPKIRLLLYFHLVFHIESNEKSKIEKKSGFDRIKIKLKSLLKPIYVSIFKNSISQQFNVSG